MRLTLITIIITALLLPVGLVQADTWIENFSVISDIIPGENTEVLVTVGYDFTSQVQLNPSIFSFEADDWIVDLLDPVIGTGTENYTLEFPTPIADGEYFYQANVWYTRNNRWYYDGNAAAYNFTIQVGDQDIPQIEEYVNILGISKPESLNISSSVDLNITIQYSYTNLTEVSINVHNSESEIIAEEFDSLEGVDTRDYQLSFIAPSEAGTYSYTVNIDSETANSTIGTSQGFSIDTIATGGEDIPPIEESLNIVEFTIPDTLNVSSTVGINMILQHSFINWTSVTVYVKTDTSNIIVEESDSLAGEGTKEYSLSFTAPSESGSYVYSLCIESEAPIQIVICQEFEIETVAPVVEPEPTEGKTDYFVVLILLGLAIMVSRYVIKKD